MIPSIGVASGCQDVPEASRIIEPEPRAAGIIAMSWSPMVMPGMSILSMLIPGIADSDGGGAAAFGGAGLGWVEDGAMGMDMPVFGPASWA